MLYIMKEGVEVLTESQKIIQDQIVALQKSIADIQPIIKKESKDVVDDNALIKDYTDQLKVLQDKLNNVVNTQQSTYNSIKGKIADKKKEIETCNFINKPNALKDDINANQNELSLQEKLTKIKTDTNKLLEDAAPYESKTTLLTSDIIALNREIEKINKEIIELDKIKQNNILQIEELNKNVKVLDRTIFELETKNYSNTVVNNENLLNVSEDMDTSMNYLFTYLNKQVLSSNSIYEKINNRDREHELLYNRNKIVDILFFCFYFSFLLIMICTQNIQREHFLIYLFVGLVPFIYPFVFKYVLYLIKYLSTDIHGPKNAFVDINNTLIAYNDV